MRLHVSTGMDWCKRKTLELKEGLFDLKCPTDEKEQSNKVKISIFYQKKLFLQ